MALVGENRVDILLQHVSAWRWRKTRINSNLSAPCYTRGVGIVVIVLPWYKHPALRQNILKHLQTVHAMSFRSRPLSLQPATVMYSMKKLASARHVVRSSTAYALDISQLATLMLCVTGLTQPPRHHYMCLENGVGLFVPPIRVASRGRIV
jgi:hypothetical protein